MQTLTIFDRMVRKDITMDELAKNFDIDNFWYVKETRKRISEIETELLELKKSKDIFKE